MLGRFLADVGQQTTIDTPVWFTPRLAFMHGQKSNVVVVDRGEFASRVFLM